MKVGDAMYETLVGLIGLGGLIEIVGEEKEFPKVAQCRFIGLVFFINLFVK
jgi:hypothetical protein